MSLENLSSALFSAGSGGILGFLAGFAIKHVFKILAVIVGLFFVALMYLQSQSIVSINWNKLQHVSEDTLTTIATSLTDTDQISSIAGNLGIPLTGGLAAGFAIGFMKG